VSGCECGVNSTWHVVSLVSLAATAAMAMNGDALAADYDATWKEETQTCCGVQRYI